MGECKRSRFGVILLCMVRQQPADGIGRGSDHFRRSYEGETKALARSLADMAAFMQEVEMRQGWAPRPVDGRGIERMRQLARRLETLATSVS